MTGENLSSEFGKKGAGQPVHPHKLISAFVIHFLESIISKLDATSEISIFKLVSVAVETGWVSLLSETPKTVFLASRPIWHECTLIKHKECLLLYSCIDFYSFSCLNPLSNERKSMFRSGDSRAVWTWVWTWKYLHWALHLLPDVIYGKRCGPDWSFSRCFCSWKRCVRLWFCDDVMTFKSLQPTPFRLEKSCVRKRKFNVLAVFSVQIWLE